MYHTNVSLENPAACNYFGMVVDLKPWKERDHILIFTCRETVLIQNHQRQPYRLEQQFPKWGPGALQGQTYFHNNIKTSLAFSTLTLPQV